MAQEPIEIKEHIDAERERLGQDIQEIEYRMKDAVDWRSWYESNTVAMLGAAAAGGFLLAMLVDREQEEERSESTHRFIAAGTAGAGGAQSVKSRAAQNPQLKRIVDMLENSFSALVGLGATKFQDYVSQVVPGFREKYEEVERTQHRPTA